MNKILDTYEGYEISYNEEESKFEAKNEDGETLQAETLKAIKSSIDKIGVEPKLKQPAQDAIRLNIAMQSHAVSASIEELTVGAFGYKRRWHGSPRTLYAWVMEKGNKRGRERQCVDMSENHYTSRNIYNDTPEAREIVSKIIELSKESDTVCKNYQKKIDELQKKLKPVTCKVDEDKLPNW